MLVELGAEAEAKDDDGKTPQMLAAERNFLRAAATIAERQHFKTSGVAVAAVGGYEDSSSDDGAGAGFASFAKDSDSELDEGDSDYGDALDDIDDSKPCCVLVPPLLVCLLTGFGLALAPCTPAAMTAKPASASRKRAPLAPLASSKRTQRPAAAAAQRGSMSRAAARKKKRQRTRR